MRFSSRYMEGVTFRKNSVLVKGKDLNLEAEPSCKKRVLPPPEKSGKRATAVQQN